MKLVSYHAFLAFLRGLEVCPYVCMSYEGTEHTLKCKKTNTVFKIDLVKLKYNYKPKYR